MSQKALLPHQFDTILNADAVEFCTAPEHENILIAGTYQLAEGHEGRDAASQTRHGRLYTLMVDDPDAEGGGPSLRCLHALDAPGVFDIKWSGRSSGMQSVLGQAGADGLLHVYTLGRREEEEEEKERGEGGECLKLASSFRCSDTPGSLALSLDWNDRCGAERRGRCAAVSLSDGRLCLVQMREDGSLFGVGEWQGHELECWIAAWDCHREDVLYSGADDGVLKCWDIRGGGGTLLHADKRSFQAGVTCIQSHGGREHYLAVGSYDETVKIYDTRKMRSPVAEKHVGGGVWRVKWCPTDPSLLAVARMHAGFAVLKFDHLTGKFSEGMKEHAGGHVSLGYGIDWRGAGAGAGAAGRLLASASFYDHLVEVWRLTEGEEEVFLCG